MNCWNSLSVEAVAGTGVKTGTSGIGASEGLTPLVAGVSLGLTDCFGSLRPTVLGGTFLQERKPRAIFVERSLLLFN